MGSIFERNRKQEENMRLIVGKKQLFTVAFVLFLAAEMILPYTLVSQLTLILFCAMSLFSLREAHVNAFLASYGLFAVVSLVNIVLGYAVDRRIAMEMTMTLFLNWIFLFAFTQYCAIIKDPVAVLKTYKKICVFVSCFFLVLGLPRVLSGERLSVLNINPNAIGVFAAYSLTVLIYELYQKRPCTVWAGLQLVIFVAVILLSASRKSMLIPMMGWYVMVCLKKPRMVFKYTLIIVVFISVLLFLILNIPVLYRVAGYRVETLLLFFQGADFEEASFDTRSHFIQYGWESAQDSLFLGHGLDCFRTLPKAYGTYSHNNYIEVLYSLGWIGIVVYYSSSILALLKSPKMLKYTRTEGALVLALLIPFLVCDYLNVSYFTRRMLVIPTLAIMYIWRLGHGKIKRSL